MNQLETSKDEVKLEPRPMFASTWITLYDELRKHYTGRHVMVSVNMDKCRAKESAAKDKD